MHNHVSVVTFFGWPRGIALLWLLLMLIISSSYAQSQEKAPRIRSVKYFENDTILKYHLKYDLRGDTIAFSHGNNGGKYIYQRDEQGRKLEQRYYYEQFNLGLARTQKWRFDEQGRLTEKHWIIENPNPSTAYHTKKLMRYDSLDRMIVCTTQKQMKAGEAFLTSKKDSFSYVSPVSPDSIFQRYYQGNKKSQTESRYTPEGDLWLKRTLRRNNTGQPFKADTTYFLKIQNGKKQFRIDKDGEGKTYWFYEGDQLVLEKYYQYLPTFKKEILIDSTLYRYNEQGLLLEETTWGVFMEMADLFFATYISEEDFEKRRMEKSRHFKYKRNDTGKVIIIETWFAEVGDRWLIESDHHRDDKFFDLLESLNQTTYPWMRAVGKRFRRSPNRLDLTYVPSPERYQIQISYDSTAYPTKIASHFYDGSRWKALRIWTYNREERMHGRENYFYYSTGEVSVEHGQYRFHASDTLLEKIYTKTEDKAPPIEYWYERYDSLGRPLEKERRYAQESVRTRYHYSDSIIEPTSFVLLEISR